MSTQVKIKDTPVTLRGRVISDRNGYQAIMTESTEPGKQIIHCLGQTRIEAATTGDRVKLIYVTTVTFDSKEDKRKRLGKRFYVAKEAIEFIELMQRERRAPESWGYWTGKRVE